MIYWRKKDDENWIYRVGVMGKGMVKNLCKANYDVLIYTRTKDKVLDILNDMV